MAMNLDELYEASVLDRNGVRVGAVGQVYLDDVDREPIWVTVRTGLFGTKEVFVPLADATLADGNLTVAHAAAQIKSAPSIDPDQHVTGDEERRLYQHYGLLEQPAVLVEPDAAREQSDAAREESDPADA